MEIYSNITPSLHPKNITSIDGYDGTTAGYVESPKVMKSALSIIDSRGPLVMIQTEKAIGANFDLIAKLRNEESATRRALIIKDHEENQA